MMTDKTAGCSICNRWEAEPNLKIIEFEQSYLMLNQDQFFPGYCLLFTKSHITELFHLQQAVRQKLMEEVNLVAAVLHTLFRADKINYELLGNMVPHIHWHLIPRVVTDRLWPRPVWAEPHQEVILSDAEYLERCGMIRKELEKVI